MAPSELRYSYRGDSRGRHGGGGRWIYLLVALLIVGTPVCYFIFFGGDDTTPPDQPPADGGTEQPADPSSGNNDGGSDPVKPPSKSSPELLQLCRDAENALSKADYGEAKALASKVLDSGVKEDDPVWERAASVLSRANSKIITTDYPLRNKKVLYTVQKGDALARIAKKYNTTVDAIQRSNNMASTNYNIRVGQTLSLYHGNWSIRVNKSKFRLYLYDDGKLFKVYNIGVGRQDRTPIGTFDIVDKIKEPDWYSPKGRIPYGSKENVLGTRWMKLKPTGTTNPNLRGYGIHGTWAPESIGKSESNGCIRMKNEEVEELFSIVPRHVEVVIEE